MRKLWIFELCLCIARLQRFFFWRPLRFGSKTHLKDVSFHLNFAKQRIVCEIKKISWIRNSQILQRNFTSFFLSFKTMEFSMHLTQKIALDANSDKFKDYELFANNKDNGFFLLLNVNAVSSFCNLLSFLKIFYKDLEIFREKFLVGKNDCILICISDDAKSCM